MSLKTKNKVKVIISAANTLKKLINSCFLSTYIFFNLIENANIKGKQEISTPVINHKAETFN